MPRGIFLDGKTFIFNIVVRQPQQMLGWFFGNCLIPMSDTEKKSKFEKFSETHLGIRADYCPTFKDTSDNLRAYLTVVAYSVAIKYLWEVQLSGSTASYVFRGIAVLWGVWVLWFFLLAIAHTYHLAANWIGLALATIFAKSIKRANDASHPFSKAHRAFLNFVAYFAGTMGMVFLFGTLYVTNALLSLAQLK